MLRANETPTFAVLLQEYFCQRLIAQRDASPATVASYRDTFRLLLAYARDRMRKMPTDLVLADIDAPLVLAFLAHLERDRGNSPRTRNARLAAIRSFLHFAAVRCPSGLPSIQRVLAIPAKRFDRRVLGFLTRDEVAAIIEAPDCATWECGGNVRAAWGCGRLSAMTPKATPSSAARVLDDADDPVARAFENAPLDNFPESEEERAEVAAARANPVFVPGSVVSAMIAERRREEG